MIAKLARAVLAMACFLSPAYVARPAQAQTSPAMHVAVTMPAHAGPFSFVYPKWIPGYHGPVGPIEAVANMRVSADGAPVTWRRDLVDPYTFATVLAPGTTELNVDFDMVTAPYARTRARRVQ